MQTGGPLLLGYVFTTFVVGTACVGAVLVLARLRFDELAHAFLWFYVPLIVLVLAALLLALVEVSGARIVERARGLIAGRSRRVQGDDSAAVWRLALETLEERAAPGTEVAAVTRGFIAIVPMRVDEYDATSADRLRRRSSEVPPWIAPENARPR